MHFYLDFWTLCAAPEALQWLIVYLKSKFPRREGQLETHSKASNNHLPSKYSILEQWGWDEVWSRSWQTMMILHFCLLCIKYILGYLIYIFWILGFVYSHSQLRTWRSTTIKNILGIGRYVLYRYIEDQSHGYSQSSEIRK